MIRGFYSARSGLLGQQVNMNTIANNFANINTNGYKPQQAAFSTLIYAKLNGGTGLGVSTGHGSKAEFTAVDYSQGGLNTTGIPTDMAILGDGFFALSFGDDGEMFYTRTGEFGYSLDGEVKSLVDKSGAFVLDSEGNRIELEAGQEITADRVGVFRFANRHGLELKGTNRFAATDNSGEAEVVESPDVRAGCLERSGVSASREVVRMIESSRAFGFNSRVLQTIDEMDDVANQLR